MNYVWPYKVTNLTIRFSTSSDIWLRHLYFSRFVVFLYILNQSQILINMSSKVEIVFGNRENRGKPWLTESMISLELCHTPVTQLSIRLLSRLPLSSRRAASSLYAPPTPSYGPLRSVVNCSIAHRKKIRSRRLCNQLRFYWLFGTQITFSFFLFAVYIRSYMRIWWMCVTRSDPFKPLLSGRN